MIIRRQLEKGDSNTTFIFAETSYFFILPFNLLKIVCVMHFESTQRRIVGYIKAVPMVQHLASK